MNYHPHVLQQGLVINGLRNPPSSQGQMVTHIPAPSSIDPTIPKTLKSLHHSRVKVNSVVPGGDLEADAEHTGGTAPPPRGAPGSSCGEKCTSIYVVTLRVKQVKSLCQLYTFTCVFVMRMTQLCKKENVNAEWLE